MKIFHSLVIFGDDDRFVSKFELKIFGLMGAIVGHIQALKGLYLNHAHFSLRALALFPDSISVWINYNKFVIVANL